MKNDRLGDKVRVEHILEAIQLIDDWTGGISFADFSSNLMLLHACLRQFEIIGEASNHLSNELQTAHPEIVWGRIIALRNLLAHEYFSVDAKFIWQIMQYDLPVFKSQMKELYQTL